MSNPGSSSNELPTDERPTTKPPNNNVKKLADLDSHALLQWIDEVLTLGGIHRDFIQKTQQILYNEGVTGRQLLEMEVVDLTKAGIGLGPAKELETQIKDLRGAKNKASADELVRMLQNLEKKLEQRLDQSQQMLDQSQQKLEQRLDQIQQKLEQLEHFQQETLNMQRDAILMSYKARRVETESNEDDGSQVSWQLRVHNHYGFNSSCCVLQQLFPKTANEMGSPQNPYFRAVCKHIIPKSDGEAFKRWGLTAHDTKNGLPLYKSLEQTFQAGKWTFVLKAVKTEAIPEIEVVIVVSKELQDQLITWESEATPVRQKGRWVDLKYNMIHLQSIILKPPPSMRALCCKALMAHEFHEEEFPHPIHHPGQFRLYQIGCDLFEGKVESLKIGLRGINYHDEGEQKFKPKRKPRE